MPNYDAIIIGTGQSGPALSAPSMVGINSDTVGRMCIARCITV
jgi:hypothetical protein